MWLCKIFGHNMWITKYRGIAGQARCKRCGYVRPGIPPLPRWWDGLVHREIGGHGHQPEKSDIDGESPPGTGKVLNDIAGLDPDNIIVRQKSERSHRFLNLAGLDPESIFARQKALKEDQGLDEIIIVVENTGYIPKRKHGSVGWDCTGRGLGFNLPPLQREKVPLGIKIAMPADCYADVRPRSGLALTSGITILNSPGLIDPDYRGEVSAIIVNLSDRGVRIVEGQNICQLVFSKDYPVKLIIDKGVYDNFDHDYPTGRGESGFGSTGR